MSDRSTEKVRQTQEVITLEEVSQTQENTAPAALGPQRKPLSTSEKRVCIAMRQEGLGYQAIADALKRSVSVVYRYLEPLEDTSVEALAKLRAASVQATEAWIGSLPVAAKDGNHKPAKDLLEAAGVIQRQPDTAIAVQVNVPGRGESARSAMPSEMADIVSD